MNKKLIYTGIWLCLGGIGLTTSVWASPGNSNGNGPNSQSVKKCPFDTTPADNVVVLTKKYTYGHVNDNDTPSILADDFYEICTDSSFADCTLHVDTITDVVAPGLPPVLDPVSGNPVLVNGQPLYYTGLKIYGSSKSDVIEGTEGPDVICGNNGNDVVYGEGGNDGEYGNNGNDKLFGDLGNDLIYGGNGNDFLSGYLDDNFAYDHDNGNNDDDFNDDDVLLTINDSDRDQLYGGNGKDQLLGGPDVDVLSGENSNDDLDGGDGLDDVRGGKGKDNCSDDDSLHNDDDCLATEVEDEHGPGHT